MKKIIIPISTLFLAGFYHAQATNTENYVQTRVYLEPVTASSSTAKQIQTVQYMDGLGSPKQVVNVKASPLGRDVVTAIVYDGFGRQTRNYLPVPQNSTSNGQIYTQNNSLVPFPVADATGIYNGETIYTESLLESSPLDRVFEQRQFGTAWANKPVQFGYDVNINGEVKKYTTTTIWENGATKSEMSDGGSYSQGQLYKNTVTDEDGNTTTEFKNSKGQTILVRKAVSASENADTYYMYNKYSQLSFVIPPLALSSTLLDNLCYQYRYDGDNRLVEKKLPGKDWEYMVYDKQNRLVASKDSQNQWIFSKYDKFGRVIYTGLADLGTRTTAQNTLDNLLGAAASNNEESSTSPFSNSGMDVLYTNTAFPTVFTKILSVNYYDSYPSYSFNPAFPSTIYGKTILTDNAATLGKSTKSLPVMTLVKNIEDDNWTKSYSYYDTKGRPIGSYSINHLGGYTKTESEIDFAGAVLQTKTYHKRLATDTEKVITETFTYDHQNRLLTHKHKIDNNTEEILAQNTYNELSQLQTKKVGGTNAATPLQSIKYKYNIRGWMTHINDPANLGNDLFGYKIKYNQVEGLQTPDASDTALQVTPKYNGNIAEVDWRTAATSNESLKRYGYVYDGLNRLSAGFYQNDTNPSVREYFEKVTYDLNGNIKTMKRTAQRMGATAMLIDNLTYQYENNNVSNRLQKITDAVTTTQGYPYKASPTNIGYDDNGNMTSFADKGISSIQYNYLNLPKQITQNSVVTNYTYRADGTKLKKLFNGLETDYLDGFQYKFTQAWEDPLGTMTNDEMKLRIIPTAEGYFDALRNMYFYNYTDHLGNVRLSYSDADGNGEVTGDITVNNCYDTPDGQVCNNYIITGEVEGVTNYYPFGMMHNSQYYNFENAYNYKYQGQELQETGFYSFKWRNYMPDVGRFFNIDPLAEKYTHNSTYAFSENRVIDARELEGLEAELINKSTRNTPVSNDISGFNLNTPAKVELRTNVVQGSFTNEQVQQKLSTVENNFKKEGFDLTIIQDSNATYNIDMTFSGQSVTVVNDDGTTTSGTVLGDAPLGNPITATVNAKNGNTDTITHEIGHTFGAEHIWEPNSGVENTPDNINNRMNSYENPTSSMKGLGTQFNKNQIQKMEETVKANSFRLPQNKK